MRARSQPERFQKRVWLAAPRARFTPEIETETAMEIFAQQWGELKQCR